MKRRRHYRVTSNVEPWVLARADRKIAAMERRIAKAQVKTIYIDSEGEETISRHQEGA